MYKYHDGGKIAAGFKGKTDCGIRAVAIACQMSYTDSRKLLKEFALNGKQGSRAISKGMYRDDLDAALRSIGWEWCQPPTFVGRKARYDDVPIGRVILRMANHYAAVIDGVLLDSFDSSAKMVYGYWQQQPGEST